MLNAVLVYEPNVTGHYPFFLELICTACLESGYRVIVATPQDSPSQLSRAVTHVPIAQGNESFRVAVGLAKKFQCQMLFLCSMDTLLYTDEARDAIKKNELGNLALYGFWIKPYAVIQRTLMSVLSKGYRRASRVLGNLNDLSMRGNLKRVFVLDEDLVQNPPTLFSFPFEYVPDPWRPFIERTRQAAREKLGLPLDKVIVCHVGDDTRRKGLLDVLTAFDQIAASSVLLVRGGRLNRRTLKKRKLLERLQQRGAFICFNRWLTEDEFDLIMQAADYVLIPYHSHVGSSGILSRAIGHRRPVIASDYGLIGRRVKKYNLGYLYTDCKQRALKELLFSLDKPTELNSLFDRAKEDYSPDQTVSCLVKALRAYHPIKVRNA